MSFPIRAELGLTNTLSRVVLVRNCLASVEYSSSMRYIASLLPVSLGVAGVYGVSDLAIIGDTLQHLVLVSGKHSKNELTNRMRLTDAGGVIVHTELWIILISQYPGIIMNIEGYLAQGSAGTCWDMSWRC